MSVHRCGLYPRVKKSETASAVIIQNLPNFCDEPVAILVHNTEEVRDEAKGGGVKPANWGVPGGGIKSGEEPEAAVLRELRQETGIIAPPGSAEQTFFRHSFMFREDADGVKPAYRRCNNVVEALHMGQVDEHELVHQSLNWAFLIGAELTETLRKAFTTRQRALGFGSEYGVEEAPEEREYGALILWLNNDLAEELGIVEAIEGPDGRREIDAIGLFPLSQIELIRENGPKGFSRSHMGYIVNARKRLNWRNA